jgi:hypothetical protein
MGDERGDDARFENACDDMREPRWLRDFGSVFGEFSHVLQMSFRKASPKVMVTIE